MSRTVPSNAGGLVGAALLAALFALTGVLLGSGTDTEVERRGGPVEATAERDFVVGLDLDGDGRQDQARFRGTEELYADWTVTATMANGAKALATLPLVHNVAAWPVDINDDGRSELIVREGGNTWTTASILVLDGGELQTVRGADGPVTIGWGAHSNCCPAGTADVACGTAAGGLSQLVITTSQLVSPAWDGRWPIIDDQPFAAFAARPQRRAWDRTVYRLDGATLTEVSTDQGVLVGEDPEPAGLPLTNSLDCDGARD
jgi:hypothetical protein